jgi:Uma2 family endonuclease
VNYPTSDGKPMAETELHGQDMIDSIEALRDHFAGEPDVYVWGNMLMYYVEGDPRKSLAPDVFFVRGVPKEPPRKYYLVWLEGKAPDAVIEITSKTTRRNDQGKKLVLYRDVLQVPEYFQFDPTEDYLHPPLQGFRLAGGRYDPIAAVRGRLPSVLLGLHLERDGTRLRFYDPVAGRYLLTRAERVEAERHRADAERHRADAAAQRADAERQRVEAERQRADAERHRADDADLRVARVEEENERLRRLVEELRGRQAPGS